MSNPGVNHLHRVTLSNFLSLRRVSLEFGAFNVLVGPNGAGKSNLLLALQLLGEVARNDLGPTVAAFGGLDQLTYRGKGGGGPIKIEIEGEFTQHASPTARDEYRLSFWANRRYLQRYETFTFKRVGGRGRRITIKGGKVEVRADERITLQSIQSGSAGLSTLQRLGKRAGAPQVSALAGLFETFRVFEVDVAAARRPAAVAEGGVGSTT